jgi:manganese oxidase
MGLLRLLQTRNMKIAMIAVSALLIAGMVIGGNETDTTRESAEINPPMLEAGANDNRHPAGTATGNGRVVELTARKVSWRPQEEITSPVEVYAFAEGTEAPTIPGPFVRLRVGESLTLRIKNAISPGDAIGLPPQNRRYQDIPTQTGDTLTVRGLEGAFGTEPFDIPQGETRELRLKAVTPGEYFYWGSTTRRPLRSRTGPESQLTGLIVIDPADGRIDPDERFFVITMVDAFPEKEEDARFGDMFEPVINGRAWPKTERLHYELDQEVRWRWINGSGFEHPMHLHGFHFRVLEWSDGVNRTKRNPVQEVVTELMQPGTSFTMAWTPTREGAWLMHCHIKDHVAGTLDEHRHDASPTSDKDHAFRAMDGLVMGITVSEADVAEQDLPQRRKLRLVAMERPSEIKGTSHQGFTLFDGDIELSAFSAPGPAIFLNRGFATRIAIENQLEEPTAVHWHGLELQSMYDGVPGWSRTREKVSPLLQPGDTFDVVLDPPKAGTYMYHTHMDATRQINNGMFGPLIVLEPGEEFNSNTDKVFLFGDSIDGRYQGVTINGREKPESVTLTAGESYRFRFINITEGAMLTVSLMHDGNRLNWSPLAKDGADLPPQLQAPVKASFLFNAGETYDFIYSPTKPMKAALVIDWEFATSVGGRELRQTLLVE